MAEVFGVVAGSFQLAATSLKAYKLVKSLREAHEEIEQHVKVVEDIKNSVNAIESRTDLTPEQRQLYRRASDGFQDAVDDLEEQLRSLEAAKGKRERFKRSIKTQIESSKLKESFGRLLHYQTSFQTFLASTIQESTFESNAIVKRTFSEVENTFSEVQKTFSEAQKTLIEAQAAKLLLQKNEIGIEAVLANQDAYYKNSEQSRHLLVQLVEDLKLVVVEQGKRLPQPSDGTSQDISKDPSGAKDTLGSTFKETDVIRKGRSRLERCSCEPEILFGVNPRNTAFPNVYSIHTNTCARRLPKISSSQKSSLFNLWPGRIFILGRNGALQSFSRWNVGYSLRTYRTVRRSESPVFSQIDELVQSQTLCLHNFQGFMDRKGREEQLDETRVVLESMFRRGHAYPTDVDENGISVWQAVLRAVNRLVHSSNDSLVPGFTALLIMLLKNGVKPDQEYRAPGTPELGSIWVDSAYELAYRSGISTENFWLPFYREFEAAGFVEECGNSIVVLQTLPRFRRVIAQRHPEVLNDLGLAAIHERLLLAPTVQQFMRTVTKRELREFAASKKGPEFKSAAITWPESMSLLSEAGCDLTGVLAEACRSNHVESVRAMLELKHVAITSHDLDEAFWSGDEIWEAVAEELVKRRDLLYQVAGSILKPGDSVAMIWELASHQISGEEVGKLLDVLARKYSKELDGAFDKLPGPCASHATLKTVSLFSSYEYPLPAYAQDFISYIQRVNCLLAAGFHALHEPNQEGETLIYRLCRWMGPDQIHDDEDGALKWLLFTSPQDAFPTDLVASHETLASPTFYLANFFREVKVSDSPPLRSKTYDLSARIQFLQNWKSFHRQIPTDDCSCFCSAGGCMFHYMFLRCDGYTCQLGLPAGDCLDQRSSVAARYGYLHQWGRELMMFGFSQDSYYEGACRLEIFERLGMRHTCCASGRRDRHTRAAVEKSVGGDTDLLAAEDPLTYRFKRLQRNILHDYKEQYRWRRMDEEERLEFQAEDGHLERQLDHIVQSYISIRRQFLNTPPVLGQAERTHYDFWDLWWVTMDAVLPPLGKDKCVYRGQRIRDGGFCESDGGSGPETLDQVYATRRRAVEEEALRQAGYEGESLESAIRMQLWKLELSIGVLEKAAGGNDMVFGSIIDY